VRCGLLPGTYRAALLREGRLTEGELRRDALSEVQALAVFNALRGWLAARLQDVPETT
jgi:branched-subunit amino acid aminotransferase/4-amino-4-deoxychorismate lyase